MRRSTVPVGWSVCEALCTEKAKGIHDSVAGTILQVITKWTFNHLLGLNIFWIKGTFCFDLKEFRTMLLKMLVPLTSNGMLCGVAGCGQEGVKMARSS